MMTEDKLFIGVFPCGLGYADRTRERNGDYVRLAFLSFASLKLEIERDCPIEFLPLINKSAKELQDRRGYSYPIAQTSVILGENSLPVFPSTGHPPACPHCGQKAHTERIRFSDAWCPACKFYFNLAKM